MSPDTASPSSITAPYRGVLFDLDNTLADRAGAFRRTASAFYDSEPAIRAAAPKEAAVSKLIEFDKDGLSGRNLLMEQVLNEWPGISRSFDELVSWYSNHYLDSYAPDPRVQQLVRALTKAGIPWGIVTNGNPDQRAKLPALGLDGLPSCVVVSAEIGHWKPDPEIFLEALRRLGLAANRDVLFVGDNPVAGVVGARLVGLATAWVRRSRTWPESEPPPDYEVDHVADLAPVLGLELDTSAY